MSLNAIEQALYDYVRRRPEEYRFLTDKVLSIESEHGTAAPEQLSAILWRYLEERTRADAQLRIAVGPATRSVSLRNLAEYLLRTRGKAWMSKRPPSS